jgi:hypothetical protein
LSNQPPPFWPLNEARAHARHAVVRHHVVNREAGSPGVGKLVVNRLFNRRDASVENRSHDIPLVSVTLKNNIFQWPSAGSHLVVCRLLVDVLRVIAQHTQPGGGGAAATVEAAGR